MHESETPRPTLLRAAGARAAEARLLDEIEAAVAARDAEVRAALARREIAAVAAALAAPLRVVVPSRSLREHVIARIAARLGRAAAAVSVHTHYALALAVVERAGESPPRGDALLGVFVRRFAREEPALAAALGDLDDGYGVVEAAVRDLVDAGFEPADAERAAECLADLGAAPDAARAVAIVRVAARVLTALAEEGLAPRAALVQRATELVRDGARDGIATRALWIHGFADATGVVVRWLEQLQASFAGRVLVDAPLDPLDATRREDAFARPFIERLGGLATHEECGAPGPPALVRVRALGAIAELREVAVRIRALLDDEGVAPESIGVVARDLGPLRAAITSQLARLAVPYACQGLDAAPDARARRLAAWTRLAEERELAPVDVWLAAAQHAEEADPDLRVGLHVLGLGRLADLGAADASTLFGDASGLPLPVRRGAVESEPGGDDDAPRGRRVRRRRLRRDRFEDAHRRVRALLAAFAGWPARASFAEHRARVETLLESELGWRRADEDAPLFAALDALADEVPAHLALARDEAARLVGRAFEQAARRAPGGAGAGVAVLSAMQARSRTFDHLFVVGLVRDAFPAKPPIDALLPDPIRAKLRDLLPDLPIKSRARAEERHLFAELVSAAPRVTLSWSSTTDEGRECAASPFVERLGFGAAEPEIAGVKPGPRRAHEALLDAALRAPRDALVPLRAAALREARRGLGDGVDFGALAAAQLAALEEIDPDLATSHGRARRRVLSQYLGLVGAIDAAGSLPVTALERLAGCPWRHFLARELGLESVPDALAALPALEPLLVGQVVHGVLEGIAVAAGRPAHVTLAELERGGARRVPWPEPAALRERVAEVARSVAQDAGVRSALYARVLARAAEPLLAVARDTDWVDGEGPPVLGVELEGEVAVADGATVLRIGFRADRVDADATRIRLVDYKTGKVPSEGKGADTRARHFRADVQSGRALQAVAYLAAVQDRAESVVEGRYLYLRPDAEPALRERIATRADADLVAHFEDVVRATAGARRAGVLPPRLEEPNGDAPRRCASCEVAAACRVGESSARGRLRAWLEHARAAGAALADDERAALRLLDLGQGAREPNAAGATGGGA